jgi:hypothetical protein
MGVLSSENSHELTLIFKNYLLVFIHCGRHMPELYLSIKVEYSRFWTGFIVAEGLGVSNGDFVLVSGHKLKRL